MSCIADFDVDRLFIYRSFGFNRKVSGMAYTIFGSQRCTGVERMKIRKHILLPIIISLVLFVIPFFWFRSGEMDLGGDSSRLYFYDPISYIFKSTLYVISPSSFGLENLNYVNLPFITLLIVLKSVIFSPTILASAFYGFSLSAAFVFCFLIIKELIDEEKSWYAAVVGSLLYVLSPALIDGWKHVLINYNQVFLNPLMFYLLLRYFKTSKLYIIFIIILLTFIFSPNFSIGSAPSLFSFYPLSMLFLILYTKFILKRNIIIKHLVLGFIFFIGIQAFHIIPQIGNIFLKGSDINTTIFSDQGKFDRGLSYFSAIAPNIKASINLLGLPQMKSLNFFSNIFLITPFVIVVAFFFNKKKTIFLTLFFFFIALFFATANITNIGLSFYKALFNIPGFSMFRNFYGQWQFAYIFFYSILFGQAFYIVIKKLNKQYVYALIFFLVTILTINAVPLIKGDVVNEMLWQSDNIRAAFQMDPDYEKALTFIRSLPSDAKVLTLPMTDPSYQIIAGKNGGAYMGPSTIAYLGGKKDFAGTGEFGKYKSLILRLVRYRQYDDLKIIFRALNIKYIFYNADAKVYDNFPAFPYSEARKFFPNDQKSYKEFVESFKFKEIKNINNKFFIFELPDSYYLPQIFTANKSISFNRPVDEIQTPLSLNEVNSRLAIYDSSEMPIINEIIFDESLIDIRGKSLLSDFLISTQKSKFNFPFASWKMTSLIYPYIVFKEKQELASYKNADKVHIDRRIFLAEKRIAELEKWGKETSILGNVRSIDFLDKTWQEPNVLGALIFKKFNFWEVSLLRYRKQIHDLIDVIEETSEHNPYFIVNKAKVRKSISFDSDMIYRIIQSDEKLSEKQKIYLLKLSMNMFDSILNRLQFTMPSGKEVDYDLTQIPKGKYDLFVEAALTQNYDQSKLQVITDGKKLSFSDFKKDNNWLKNPDSFIKEEGQNSLKLLIPEPINLTSKTKWRSVEEGSLATDSVSLTINDENLIDRVGLIREIADWSPMSYYVLSFDYLTYGKSFKLSVFDKGLLESDERSRILEDNLKSQEWKTYATVLVSGDYASSAFMQIIKPISTSLLDEIENRRKITKIDIKNLSVTQVPNPKIILRKVIVKSDQDENLPKIIFSRINPARYSIKIKNASMPYTLVLAEAFSSKWKLTDPTIKTNNITGFFSRFIANIGRMLIIALKQGNQGEKSVVMEYFNGDVTENFIKDTFLNERTFDTWGKEEIAKYKHFQVNGYSNAWYIEPSDVEGKTEYTLNLEMATQKVLYRSLVVSILTAIVCVIFLIVSLLKRIPK